MTTVHQSTKCLLFALLLLASGCTIFRVLTDQPGAATQMENGTVAKP